MDSRRALLPGRLLSLWSQPHPESIKGAAPGKGPAMEMTSYPQDIYIPVFSREGLCRESMEHSYYTACEFDGHTGTARHRQALLDCALGGGCSIGWACSRGLGSGPGPIGLIAHPAGAKAMRPPGAQSKCHFWVLIPRNSLACHIHQQKAGVSLCGPHEGRVGLTT